jgi:carbonic anhydrase
MAFSWQPFGSTRDDDLEPARPPALEPSPSPPRGLRPQPARRLAVLTCMDCRIDPLRALDLNVGDAVVLRNAGAQASEDVLRSLRMAHEALGVTFVQVVAHTDCAAHGGDDDASAAGARRAAARIRSMLPALRTEAAVLDLASGAVSRPAG